MLLETVEMLMLGMVKVNVPLKTVYCTMIVKVQAAEEFFT